jgi:hypothetical protein
MKKPVTVIWEDVVAQASKAANRGGVSSRIDAERQQLKRTGYASKVYKPHLFFFEDADVVGSWSEY